MLRVLGTSNPLIILVFKTLEDALTVPNIGALLQGVFILSAKGGEGTTGLVVAVVSQRPGVSHLLHSCISLLVSLLVEVLDRFVDVLASL